MFAISHTIRESISKFLDGAICINADLDTPAADNAVPKTSKKETAR